MIDWDCRSGATLSYDSWSDDWSSQLPNTFNIGSSDEDTQHARVKPPVETSVTVLLVEEEPDAGPLMRVVHTKSPVLWFDGPIEELPPRRPFVSPALLVPEDEDE